MNREVLDKLVLKLILKVMTYNDPLEHKFLFYYGSVLHGGSSYSWTSGSHFVNLR